MSEESFDQEFSAEQGVIFLRDEEFAIGSKLKEEIAKNPEAIGVTEARDLLEALTLATDIAEELISRKKI